ncbi:MAG: FAD-dependent oxidoreductase [Nitrospirota bacterium]
MNGLENNKDRIIILGGGLAGLSAGYLLSGAGRDISVFESNPEVGGLSRTVEMGDFRFDLGGHRFFTNKERIERFVKELMDGELITVPRKSKIYLRNIYFDYPLKPSNVILGLGVLTTFKIITDFFKEMLKKHLRTSDIVSLEDWVVTNFGRTMFNLYFKEYSEKVWGTESERISKEWVAKRIKGLSLGTAIKSAFFKFSKRGIATLADDFLYPSTGIGRISEKLRDGINEGRSVITNTKIVRLNHNNHRIETAIAKNCDLTYIVEGREFISTIPLTTLVQILHPKPPEDILSSASKLRFRDLIIVTIAVNRERVTDLTWLYLPERKIPFGRIHEPKNWSSKMAPEGKTHIVTEHFCFEGDETWIKSDAELVKNTILGLEDLGFFKSYEVVDSAVIRVPKAYPLFEIGYREHYDKIINYFERFENLHITGRGGMFRYHNMDDAIETGIETAEKIINNSKGYAMQDAGCRILIPLNPPLVKGD